MHKVWGLHRRTSSLRVYAFEPLPLPKEELYCVLPYKTCTVTICMVDINSDAMSHMKVPFSDYMNTK